MAPKNLGLFIITLSTVFILNLAGCGGDKSEEKKGLENTPEASNPSNPSSPNSPPAFESFGCETSLNCDSSHQFCLISKRSDNNAVYFHECREIPQGTTRSCDWASQASKDAYPNVENCKHWVQCDQTNSKITVTCFHNM